MDYAACLTRDDISYIFVSILVTEYMFTYLLIYFAGWESYACRGRKRHRKGRIGEEREKEEEREEKRKRESGTERKADINFVCSSEVNAECQRIKLHSIRSDATVYLLLWLTSECWQHQMLLWGRMAGTLFRWDVKQYCHFGRQFGTCL
jgi:hypothetical protein